MVRLVVPYNLGRATRLPEALGPLLAASTSPPSRATRKSWDQRLLRRATAARLPPWDDSARARCPCRGGVANLEHTAASVLDRVGGLKPRRASSRSFSEAPKSESGLDFAPWFRSDHDVGAPEGGYESVQTRNRKLTVARRRRSPRPTVPRAGYTDCQPATRRIVALFVVGVLFTVTLMAVAAGPTALAGAATATCAAPAKVNPAEEASTTGITANSVTVGNISITSGPVPGLFEGAPTGVKAYFAYVNSHGGVNGRRLQVQSYDTGFSGEQNETEAQQAVNSDFAMVGNFSLFDNYSCSTVAENPAFSDVSVTLDSATNALPNEFSPQPLTIGVGHGPNPGEYIRHKYPKAIKVGTIIATNALAIIQWRAEKTSLEQAGFHVVYAQKVSPLTTSFTSQVIQMRKEGVQVVYLMIVDWQIAAIVSQEMAEQGWHPTVVYSGAPIYTTQFIPRAGGPADTDGDYIIQGQALYLGEDAKAIPADAEFLKSVNTVNPGWDPDLFTLYGWASAQLFVQALKAAGPHPTRGLVLAQLKKVTAFAASGLLAPADPAKKTPASCFLIARIEHGAFVRVKPTGSGFTCSGGS